ncbi:ATP-binding cassette domain-containing protein [Geobacter sp. SVR]|uniref:ABC transporter ATP-binding protein n=1 Tax=Geobacter sp. SVR TaxID=2495594 RepID=UPI00143EF65E|nr:ATP-binding cassette domain-containing protein [Geobacter sp. SVR]BCS55033.1 phosphate ABC transporter ATP-binding protein [Geobacter sp. SVR]GCF85214.1 hypothetical protein GSbR_18140 [Geobacter sp. SVR]
MGYGDKTQSGTRVTLERVGVVRKSKGQDTTILHDISFDALAGEITTIVGPSGSGKSTLIRLINRLDEPSSGTISLNGESITAMDPLSLRRRVAMVLQKPFMFEGTVLDNLQRPFLYRREIPPHGTSEKVERVLSLAKLSPKLLERDARSLSGGEQQRVNLARALIGYPEVLLLDEPTSALDRPTADHLAATLHDVCRSEELAIIMVTHDLRLAEHTAYHLIYLEQGRIVEAGNAAELWRQPKTEAFRRFLAEPVWKENPQHGK